jgi:DNA-binding NarL/FixJ family response regulator
MGPKAKVLTHLSEGLTNKEIAHRMGLSDQTVKHHVTSVLDKLGVRNRVEAAVIEHRTQPPR